MLGRVSDEETDVMRATQEQRAEREEKLAKQSGSDSEEAEHLRRAEKARYLEARLEERARAEGED
jgi:hypothetical protein